MSFKSNERNKTRHMALADQITSHIFKETVCTAAMQYKRLNVVLQGRCIMSCDTLCTNKMEDI